MELGKLKTTILAIIVLAIVLSTLYVMKQTYTTNTQTTPTPTTSSALNSNGSLPLGTANKTYLLKLGDWAIIVKIIGDDEGVLIVKYVGLERNR